jgi:hypothetical protein
MAKKEEAEMLLGVVRTRMAIDKKRSTDPVAINKKKWTDPVLVDNSDSSDDGRYTTYHSYPIDPAVGEDV